MANLSKARKNREHLSRILGREGADANMSGMFLKYVVQYTLLFNSEKFFMIPRLLWELGRSRKRVAHWVTVKETQRQTYHSWAYPPTIEDMDVAVLGPVEE